eukprot:c14062_g3_i1 orf=2-322(-)
MVKERDEDRLGFQNLVADNPEMSSLPEIPLLQNMICDFNIDLHYQHSNNYLDFLLHTDTLPVVGNQAFCSEILGLLSSGQQWEKLPPLYPEEPRIPVYSIKEEIDSC